jgi:serine/threonine protein kinase
MSDERWQRMWDLFHDLCEREAGERAARLETIGVDDPDLRRELEELLAEHDDPSVQLARDDADGAIRGLVLRPGDRVGPYRVVASIGEGGMGVVYRAEQEEPVRRTVALKLIRPGMDTREVVARFEAERRALAALEHDRIARVFDAGATEDGRPYFAMEYVDGQPITAYCDERRLSVGARLDLFREVCDGVQHAHRRGVIHRDLKPSNILVRDVDGGPAVKIIDFGIARATDPVVADREAFTAVGRILGTPEYMSPEQAGLTGEDVDTRTDVYALGVLLYELLVGATPFDWREVRRAGYDEILRIIRETEPPRPSTRTTRE